MSTRIAAICGDHPRNLFLVETINSNLKLVGALIQERENLIPNYPSFCSEKDKINYIRHFENRKIYEDQYFGNKYSLSETNIKKVDKDNLSSQDSVDFIKTIDPDIIFVFGVGVIREPLLSFLPQNTINLHSGLIPQYKGTACNFWPFYFLEPNWAGMTFHFLIKKLDGGNIIHQVVPELEFGDTIHEVACKAITSACNELKKIVEKFSKEKISGFPHKSSGRLFRNIDFRPEHLRVIYDQYDDNIVDYYLNGDLKPKNPILKKIDDLIND